MSHEDCRIWILLCGIAAAPVWIVLGMFLWAKWLGRALEAKIEDWISNWPDYQ